MKEEPKDGPCTTLREYLESLQNKVPVTWKGYRELLEKWYSLINDTVHIINQIRVFVILDVAWSSCVLLDYNFYIFLIVSSLL